MTEMASLQLLFTAIKQYVMEQWSLMDGPFYEADDVREIYRRLPVLSAQTVTVPSKSIDLPSPESWEDRLLVPRLVGENRFPLEGAGKPDLICRSNDGSGFDWLCEVKSKFEGHPRRWVQAKSALESFLFSQMDEDLEKRTHWGKTPKVFLGFYTQSPACFNQKAASGHCGSIDALSTKSDEYLKLQNRSGDGNVWFVALKQAGHADTDGRRKTSLRSSLPLDEENGWKWDSHPLGG